MKKLLLTLALIGGVSSAFAQGIIGYNNRVGSDVDARIYAPELENASISKTGPNSTQNYTGGWLSGSQYRVTLWAGAAGSAADALTFVEGSNRELRTGTAAAGLINAAGAPEITIPGVASGSSAALQLRVWDTRGGTITSWAQVLADDSILRGASAVFTSPALASSTTPIPNMVGLQSFNVYAAVPEPSTFVLAGLGAAALMVIRRRK